MAGTRPQPRHEFLTLQPWQQQVRYDRARLHAFFEQTLRSFRVGRAYTGQAASDELLLEEASEAGVVLDNKDVCHFGPRFDHRHAEHSAAPGRRCSGL